MKALKGYSVGLLALEAVLKGLGGYVANVFDRTVNVRAGEYLIVIGSHKLRSPIGVNIDLDSSFKSLIKPGAPVYSEGMILNVGGVRLDLSGAEVYTGRLPFAINYLDASSLDLAYQYAVELSVMARILGEVREGSIYLDHSVASIAIARLEKLVSHLVEVCGVDHEIIGEFLGLGKGFTPSTDDIALGIITSWNMMSPLGLKPIHIKEGLLEGTNWVSMKLLEYSSKLIVAEPIDESLYLLIAQRNLDRAISRVLDMAWHGHSSGTEIMGGLALGLALALECLGFRNVSARVMHNLWNHGIGLERSPNPI